MSCDSAARDQSLFRVEIEGDWETIGMEYTFAAALERLPGESAYFVCFVPKEIAREIDAVTEGLRAGFGSVRIKARLGESSWRTSIFRDAKRSSYLMLVKKEVRTAELLEEGDILHLTIELVDF